MESLKALFRRYNIADSYEDTTTAGQEFGPWGFFGENVTISNDDTSDIELQLIMTEGMLLFTVKAGEVWQQDMMSVEKMKFITGSIDLRVWVLGHTEKGS